MKNSSNCPNCGAPISGTRCEYCGTDFEPVYVKLDNYIPWTTSTDIIPDKEDAVHG